MERAKQKKKRGTISQDTFKNKKPKKDAVR